MYNKKIKCIRVHLGKFSIKKLKFNLKNNYFNTVTFVDIEKKMKYANEYLDLFEILSGKKVRVFAGSLINVDRLKVIY